MYAKSTRPSAKREGQKDRSAQRDNRLLRSAKRDDQIARPRRAQACERSEPRAMRMCPRSGQIFLNSITQALLMALDFTSKIIEEKHYALLSTQRVLLLFISKCVYSFLIKNNINLC